MSGSVFYPYMVAVLILVKSFIALLANTVKFAIKNIASIKEATLGLKKYLMFY